MSVNLEAEKQKRHDLSLRKRRISEDGGGSITPISQHTDMKRLAESPGKDSSFLSGMNRIGSEGGGAESQKKEIMGFKQLL